MKLVCRLSSSSPPPTNPGRITAVEEAVRLRERLKTHVKSIKAITIGPHKSLDTLRTALAMGADAAVHVQHGEEGSAGPEPLSVAKTFKAWMEKQKEGELLAFALTLSFFCFPFFSWLPPF